MSYSPNKSVQPTECDFADQSFQTYAERQEQINDGSGCDNPSIADDCESPVVIDMDGRGFAFTSQEDGVLFDLDVAGVFERVGWTEEGGDEAFLVLDRNGNGRVDDGSELFGNRTPQPDHEEPNGFLALAVFDSFRCLLANVRSAGGGCTSMTLDPVRLAGAMELDAVRKQFRQEGRRPG